MCRKRLGEEPWGSRDTHRLTRGFPLDSHNESSDYLAHLATSKWPRRRAFSPQAVTLLASQSLAAIINGVRACSVELRAARPAGFLT